MSRCPDARKEAPSGRYERLFTFRACVSLCVVYEVLNDPSDIIDAGGYECYTASIFDLFNTQPLNGRGLLTRLLHLDAHEPSPIARDQIRQSRHHRRTPVYLKNEGILLFQVLPDSSSDACFGLAHLQEPIRSQTIPRC